MIYTTDTKDFVMLLSLIEDELNALLGDAHPEDRPAIARDCGYRTYRDGDEEAEFAALSFIRHTPVSDAIPSVVKHGTYFHLVRAPEANVVVVGVDARDMWKLLAAVADNEQTKTRGEL